MGAFSFGFGLPQTGGIAGNQGVSIPGSPSSDAPWYQQLFPWASLGAQTFLADQAITSPRPATVTYSPGGQIGVVTGGGAATPLPTVASIPGIVWVGLALLLIVMLFRR